ncbi:MAG: heme-binding protein [Chloroflexota bacterium]
MLTLDDARRVMAAAEAKAAELGCAVTITVLDGGGHVRAQSRMDGARFGTLSVSANKAFTAASFGLPSKVLTGLTQPGQPLFGFADAHGGRIVIFAGGVPVVRDDEVVGAVGISGGSVDQDEEIAEAGAAAI